LLAAEAKKKAKGGLINTLIVDLEDLLCNCVEVFKDIRKYWSLSKVMAQCIQLGRVSSGRFSKRMM
jgi:hypothetical protein